jgi:MFS family permease
VALPDPVWSRPNQGHHLSTDTYRRQRRTAAGAEQKGLTARRQDVVMASKSTVSPGSSSWAPLRVSAFRSLWIAQLFSLIGTWMQMVGAQWLVVDEPNAATLVGLVQAAAMLPTLALALPAGALADILDRRRLLIAVQLFQVAVGVLLVLLTVLDLLSPAALLTVTLLLGVGVTFTIPAYQTLVGELVGRAQVRSASALNGVAMNLARAIGPAIAGLLIGAVGVAAVFALNALTYVVMAVVLIRLRPPPAEEVLLPERFRHALTAGARFVRHSPVVRRMLMVTVLFVVPGAALWTLLPLVASAGLGLDATGYGVLLGAVGVGAVLGALVLPRVVALLSPNQLVLVASVMFAAGTAVAAWAPGLVPVLVVLVPAGAAWLWMLATMNGSLQVFLPGWVRARGLSIYQMVFAGGQALASVAWGLLASAIGVMPTLLIAAALLAVGGATVLVLPLQDVSGLDRDPAVYWPEPYLEMEPAPEDGPVLVTLVYTVPAANVPRFLEAMVRVRRMKMRTGATSFALYQDGADPSRFVEVAEFPSWAEHLRQHGGRLTASDQELEEAALACADGPPEVQHLLPPSSAVRPWTG